MNHETTPIRDASVLGIPKMLILGLQHMFAMFGATILVPILVNGYFEGEGLSIQVTLICAGIGTLFFHICSKLCKYCTLCQRRRQRREGGLSCCKDYDTSRQRRQQRTVQGVV